MCAINKSKNYLLFGHYTLFDGYQIGESWR